MMTIELKVNGQLVRSIEVQNLGIIDGVDPEAPTRRWKTRPATAADDPDGDRLYGYVNSIGQQGYAMHRRSDGIEVLAKLVLEGWP